jgi:hypothetical protein
MMRYNTILHTINLSKDERDEQIYTESILPYLKTNRYRPRVLAVEKTKERPFRERMLGRALASVKTDANLVWMFLSENVDAFVRSEEAEEEEEEESSAEVAVAVAVAVVAAAAALQQGFGGPPHGQQQGFGGPPPGGAMPDAGGFQMGTASSKPKGGRRITRARRPGGRQA